MLSPLVRRSLTTSGRTHFAAPFVVRCSATLRNQQCRNDSTNTTSNTRDEHEQKKQKPGGSYSKVLGVFALGLPLGWLVRTINGDDDQIAKPGDFVKYKLVNKEEVSSTCAIFTLRPSGGARIDHEQLHDSRALTSVQFKQPQLQIARSYTVLPPTKDQSPDELRFLIRKERNGEVSGYLHRLPLETEIEVRGPGVDYILPEDVSEVLFLAGGTGIAPAMQVADRLSGKAHVYVLWASRRREDCLGAVSDTQAQNLAGLGWSLFSWGAPLNKQIEVTSQPSAANAITTQIQEMRQESTEGSEQSVGLLMDCFVDEEESFIQPADVTKKLEVKAILEGKRLVLISGPEGFVRYWAGPKEWIGGQEVQGPLGGVLARLDMHGWQVVKL